MAFSWCGCNIYNTSRHKVSIHPTNIYNSNRMVLPPVTSFCLNKWNNVQLWPKLRHRNFYRTNYKQFTLINDSKPATPLFTTVKYGATFWVSKITSSVPFVLITDRLFCSELHLSNQPTVLVLFILIELESLLLVFSWNMEAQGAGDTISNLQLQKIIQ